MLSDKNLKLLATILAILGIIEIAVGGSAFNLTNWRVGAWWAGLAIFICGIAGMLSTSSSAKMKGFFYSIFGGCVSSVAIIVDGVYFGITNSLTTCINTDTGDFYGESDYNRYALACSLDEDHQCICVKGSDDKCYLFDLTDGDDCGVILTKLPSLLLASLFICLSCFLILIVYGSLSFKSVEQDILGTHSLTTDLVYEGEVIVTSSTSTAPQTYYREAPVVAHAVILK